MSDRHSLADLDRRLGTCEVALRDSQARCEAAEAALAAMRHQQQMLLGDVQHRVRNVLTVVRSVFARTIEAGGDVTHMTHHFRGRLDSLSRAHVAVTQSVTGLVDLENLVRDELLSVGVTDGPAVTIEGPEVALSADAVDSIGLALHELTTNAVKFGALQTPGARLDIRWTANLYCGSEARLHLTWTEAGVPGMPVAPARRGFGSEMIIDALPYRLGAETSLHFLGGGVRCTMSVPLRDPADRVRS